MSRKRKHISLCNEKHLEHVLVLAIAIAAKQDGKLTATPTYPCGACRQALVQYESKGGVPMTVIVGSAGRVEVFASVRDLLPFVFDNLDDKPGE